MSDILRQLNQEKEYIIALRREFHQHPELSLQEYRTARRIEEELDRFGISHSRVGETGVLGILRGIGQGEGATVLRADTDALPIQETNTVSYCSQTEGVMHACGHDAHIACLLGAAKVLAANRDAFGGEVRLVFQPAEEIGRGAKPFLEAGILEGADRVFGLHTAPDIPSGQVGLKPGLNNAAVDHFKIVIQGKSAHVSTPHLGIDALYIASHIVVALQALVTRCNSPVEPVIIGVGKLAAGTTYNALAETAVLEGTTRTVSQGSRERMQRLVTETVQGIAGIYGGHGTVQWTDFASALINDAQVCQEVTEVVERLWGDGKVTADRRLSLGGDNFAEYILRTSGAYAYLGTGNPEKPGTLNAAHNGNFDIDEDALILGASLYAGYALIRRGTVG
ncbi:MAG: amidohydrolase [bacterium]|nr:amidohydrolase [bacterium]MCM1374810.1 amidohydrolase [Muribaculum sp.]